MAMPTAPGSLAELLLARPATASQELPPNTEPHYSLYSFEDFRRYIIEADIKLVRPQYLRELLAQGRIFPRRQEAEKEPGALFKPTEEDNFRVVTISHSWESMEHPDPCGFQLKQIVRRIDLDMALQPIFRTFHIDFSRTDVFFFIDFVCLYQYKREDQGQDESFRRAMTAMHLFYANANSGEQFRLQVWRIERLTPRRTWWWQSWKGCKVRVFHALSGGIAEVPLQDVLRNTTPYCRRGWCAAEVEWSQPVSIDISHPSFLQLLLLSLPISCQFLKQFCLACLFVASVPEAKPPMTPEAFRRRLQSLKFTHRADLEPLSELQRRVFADKMLTKDVAFGDLGTPREISALLELVPSYTCLCTFSLFRTYLRPRDSHELLLQLMSKTALRKLNLDFVPLSQDAVHALADGLECGESPLQVLSLVACGLSPTAAALVAGSLAANFSVEELNLSWNTVKDEGAVAFSKALRTNRCLKRLILATCRVGNSGALALGAALETNRTLEVLALDGNPIGVQGLQVLVAAKERRRREGSLELTHEMLDCTPDVDNETCLQWCCYGCGLVFCHGLLWMMTRVVAAVILHFPLWLQRMRYRLTCWSWRSGR
ncbi:NLRP5 [Symbiodinium sp. CCMP2592]|nr:NLRP5 [Symbiodinium sp. CCMP2592]